MSIVSLIIAPHISVNESHAELEIPTPKIIQVEKNQHSDLALNSTASKIIISEFKK